MPRKTKQEAERTRERILASALALFSKKGYDHTTFTDVAARLKLTKGAVYWHFESKEKLLIELVQRAFAQFRRQLEQVMPTGELTFPAVAEMMANNAEAVVSSPRGAAFFRLMKCQVRWTDASMAEARQDLLTNVSFGPRQAFVTAIRNDIAAKRVRANIDALEVASICLALWDGLVSTRLDHFLDCDLRTTLSHAYGAIWDRIRTGGSAQGPCDIHFDKSKEKNGK